MKKDFLSEVYLFSHAPFELGRYDVKRVGRELEWRRLIELLEGAKKQVSPTNTVLLGGYGAGKSFLLWQLHLHFSRTSRRRVFASRPIRLLNPEQTRDIIRNLVVRLFRRGMDIESDLGPMLSQAQRERTDVSAALAPYIELLFALNDDKRQAIARRVVTGEKVLRGEAETAGIYPVTQIQSNEAALDLLLALQVILRWAEYELLILCIDEVEYIDQTPLKQQGRVFDSLKSLWDSEVSFASSKTDPLAAPLAMVFAATPTFWQSKVQLLRQATKQIPELVGLNPFFARIPQANVIEMPEGLEKDEARKLIIERMSEAREEDKPSNPIIPFTEDYVIYVFELTQGVPRKIIEICQIVVAEAAKREVKRIDTAVAKEILRDLLITYEPVVALST